MVINLKAGIQGNVYVVREICPEFVSWTQDHSRNAKQLDLFKQFVSSQQPLATQEMDEEAPDQEAEEDEPEELGPGASQHSNGNGVNDSKCWTSAQTVFDCYEPIIGFGALHVDSKNGFNELKHYFLLWQCAHQ